MLLYLTKGGNMKTKKLLDIIKSKSFSIPLYLYRMKDKFEINIEEFIFLIYLTNKGDKYIFDPKEITSDLNIEIIKMMDYISNLTEKHLISVDVIKNERGMMEEYINLNPFYEKVNMYLVEDVNNIESESETIFDTIQKEFGRLLSPIEIEIVNAWIESKYSEELIKEALKEAIMNGVTNLRYIDKILYEWNKKGIKNKEDVLNNQKKYKEEQIKKIPKKEVFDYNWLEDDDNE